MANVKITEVATQSNVKTTAHVLITQTDGSGNIERVFRAPITNAVPPVTTAQITSIINAIS